MSKKNSLVSIIVPVYNAADFLHDTIATVLAQTYEDWELLFVDDASSDDSVKIIKEYSKKDERIRLYDHGGANKGAAISRNKGIDEARGRFIAFLDADDLWNEHKLEKQLEFIRRTGAIFSCTSYEFADEDGTPNGTQVIVPDKVNYKKLITNVTVWTSTVIFDMSKIKKEEIYMPDVRIGQDAATWWKVLKKVDYAYGLKDVLAYYRRTARTLSANKFRAVKRTWNLYRNVEGFSLPKSAIYIVVHSYNAVRRRI